MEAVPMLEVAFAQLRFAASMALGVPFSPRSLDRIIDALLATRAEFGASAADGGELLRGPELDDNLRRDMQLRRFRKQAARAVRETAYYEALFAQVGLDPAHLTHADIARIPLTPKEALRDHPDAFVCRGARPVFRTTTTGTTGRPTSVLFSAYEMTTYIALGAISHLLIGDVTSEDIVLISNSARASLGNTCFAGACARIGALVHLSGLIDPAQTLALLAEEHHIPGKKARVSYLTTYASYLGQLVECGLRLGYKPSDFGLEKLSAGGEIVTPGLKQRCQELFGPVPISEGYGMTENWPMGGSCCAQGHLHFEPSVGLLEVCDPDTGLPVAPGEAGAMICTPLPPHRDTTLVLRYNTEDMVRPVPGPLTCAMRNLPAITNLLGKRRLAVRHEGGWTFPRDILEALEALPEVPLPARCGFWAVDDGVAVEVLVRDGGPQLRSRIAHRLEEHGVPLRELRLVDHAEALRRPLPLRCDLREASFAPPSPAAHRLLTAVGMPIPMGEVSTR
jgi:phenylacetate-coenzyme A ligase PaaK-like adenylate-forming protein